jgi:Fic family protein
MMPTLFAKNNVLNKENIAKAYVLLSKHILAKHQQVKLRTQNIYIYTPEGNIEYVAASPFVVDQEMQKLYEDIDLLIKEALTIEQVFFYAAIIHLVFVKIHPWMDGNGRSARLIEKWFLAQKLGHKAWFIQSEKYYYGLHQTYYNNLRLLGLEYQDLDYLKALPFLLMLPASIGVKS